MMYRNPHHRSLPAALMLLLFLAVSFFGAEGTLLCFGKDGHVAIEFEDACSGAWAGAEFEGIEDDACGPCQDIQFLNSPANANNASHYAKTLHLVTQSQLSPSLQSEGNPGRDNGLPQTPHHITLASLHSVVLLI